MLRGVPHYFLGHTTDIHTGATERARFNHGGFGAVLSSTLCVRQSTAAAANHYQVKTRCHFLILLLAIAVFLRWTCDNILPPFNKAISLCRTHSWTPAPYRASTTSGLIMHNRRCESLSQHTDESSPSCWTTLRQRISAH
jgi:hypothetical protein